MTGVRLPLLKNRGRPHTHGARSTLETARGLGSGALAIALLGRGEFLAEMAGDARIGEIVSAMPDSGSLLELVSDAVYR